ncbi:hypothetical protein ACQUQQ_00810 [Acidithiobacillus ferrooxidans]|uniref:hypothetical protein n=1 Tax=Acidithiobacillus TaxID=119977 RepID=UPI001C074C31|nr:hypothetical protein [Acidithiobacillus ferridurans]MBU2805804.1 glycosyltransferase family 1 protein [Acidithiobacillus ferridurans]
MLEPNFSESQLQQAANSAFIRRIAKSHGKWLFAHILSLPDEFLYGWDTAFYLDWFPHPPLPDHAGCNFFVQYKLSNQYTSPGAGEWIEWKQEYFRFKIPHNAKDAAGKHVDDYHQWDRLKALASKGYPTYYATNATLDKSVLMTAYEAGVLLNKVPLLDVRSVKGVHKHVTFTPTSDNFKLHSDLEDSSAIAFSAAIESLREEPHVSIGEANESLLSALNEMDQTDRSWIEDLARINQSFSQVVPQRFLPWAKHQMLRVFINNHIGASMHWMPQNG